MNKFLDGVLRLMAGICAILFILAVGVALLVFNAERRLFNASLYLQALENQDFYERLPGLTAEVLAATPSENDSNSPRAFLDLLPMENWEPLLWALLPAEVSQPMTEQAVQSVFGYLNGKSESAGISLVEFKEHLTGPGGTEAVMTLLATQPDCTLVQLAEMTLGNLLGEQKLHLCKPPADYIDSNGRYIFEPLIASSLQTFSATIPDQVDLTPEAASAEDPLQELRVVRTVMRLSPLLPLGLLFLITIFAVRTLKGWLRWWGVPLLLGGLFGLILATAINPLFKWGFAAYAAPRLPAFLPASVTETIQGLISSILAGLAAPMLLQSLALLLIGIAMLFATRLKKPITASFESHDQFGETPDEKAP